MDVVLESSLFDSVDTLIDDIDAAFSAEDSDAEEDEYSASWEDPASDEEDEDEDEDHE